MLDLPDSTTYHDPVQGKAKLDRLEQAYILVLASYYPNEAQPIYLIEAMHFGRAVIYTDHNYLACFVPSGAGFCVAPRDAATLSKAIEAYATTPRLLRGTAARGSASRARYTGDSYCTGLRRILSDDLAGHLT